MSRRSLGIVLISVLLLLTQMQPVLANASVSGSSKEPVPVAADKLRQRQPVATSNYVVEFTQQADLRPADAIEGFADRGQFVVDALQGAATDAQQRAADLAASAGAEVTQFWLRNVMVVHEPSEALIAELTALPGVATVRPEKVYPLVEPVERSAAIRIAAGDPEWGIAKIGADATWDEGILGSGVVVANVDTGVDYAHPALVDQYRGNLGNGAFSHDYSWWDPTGICGEVPCDNVDHGTHTMGTIVGGDGPGPFAPDIGVAPGARWIAAKGCEDLGCSEEALLSSGQWILAPTDLAGENPDPSKRPDIVSNSWGGGPGDPFYLDVVQAWRAAGIIPVFSTGNPGPFCGDGGSPGDFVESFSVGATDIDDLIAEFSGRGPSVYGKINPDVAAPGVDIVSSIPGGGYASFSGTSMAAPHTAGTLALVLSAAPGLIGDFDGATSSLRTTAVDIVDLTCGGDDDGDPNNVYGEGRIDAIAAVNLVATGGTLTGTVTDVADARPVAGATVTANNGERDFNASTGDDGTYRLFLAAGTYTVAATTFGYESAVASGVEVITDATTVQDLELVALPRFIVGGVVRRAESGIPIRGVTVTAVGVPVDPVTTDSRGRYWMRLPLGTYTLHATQGGCMSERTAEVELFRSVRQDFRLSQKIDDYGYGCAPIHMDWVDAQWPTAVYGDDVTGRLPMPFPFEFYGETFDEHFYIASNGYVALTDEFQGFSPFFNSPIPSLGAPNAAIYALWQDLWVVDAAHIDYQVVTANNRRALVIEYSEVANLGSSDGADFEIKLWEDGTIDLLYRSGMSNVGAGGQATVGIENADGTDAFMLSYTDPVLADGTAWRFRVVPMGTVGGVITDTNDGLPVADAVVTAEPGGRHATTDADGRYDLRLVPGRYALTVSAPGYVSETTYQRIRVGQSSTRDFALDAPVAEVTPITIEATTDVGDETTATVTISNTGSAPLEWEARERDFGGTPAELPPAPNAKVTRPAIWAPFAAPDGTARDLIGFEVFAGDLLPIIEDPAGDATGAVDIATVLGGSDGVEMSMEIAFTDDTPLSSTVGYVYLDTDQDPATGLPAEAWEGLPTQDVGMEYFVDLFAAPEGFGYVVDAETFELVAEIAVEQVGRAYRFDIPLEILDGDDGAIDVAMVLGDFGGPTDWAPDVGHGTIEPFRDAPWMSQSPDSGTIEPGASTEVTVTLGGTDLDPADYTGAIVFVTNAARVSSVSVETALTVELPADFGSVSGTVTNARDGLPVPATVVVHAERDGVPYDATAAASDVDGTYQVFVPAGTWPVDAGFEGYADSVGEVVVTAGAARTYDIALDPMWPNAVLEGGPVEFDLGPGESASAELTLTNAGGLADLEFEVLELSLDIAEDRVAAPQPDAATAVPESGTAPAKHDSRTVEPRQQAEADFLVLMDALPWDSDALLQVLDGTGAPYDLASSDMLDSLDLGEYRVVFISNDQPQAFYNAYLRNADRFSEYVDAGGFLWFGAAAEGWNGGSLDGAPLPGDVSILGGVFEELNDIVRDDHPAMAGVPNPFSGSGASHSAFDGVLEEWVIATGTDSGLATLLEYEVGAGRVLAFGQTLEFGWAQGQDAGLILENAVPYALSFVPFGDVPWLAVDPVSGTVPSDGATTLTVTVDTTGLAAGVYSAEIVVLTNDPLNRIIRANVAVTVTG